VGVDGRLGITAEPRGSRCGNGGGLALGRMACSGNGGGTTLGRVARCGGRGAGGNTDDVVVLRLMVAGVAGATGGLAVSVAGAAGGLAVSVARRSV